jgi:cytochrome c biogenesis protein CcdA
LYISIRAAVAVLLLAALALALQIGQLNFVEVTSAQSFAGALKPGPVLIYIHQPNCPDCEYLETHVFTDGRQASAQQTAMGGGPQALAQIALSFAAGAASVFSPCVLPVLTIAATTYLARRRLAAVLAGMVASYAAIATAVSAAAAWAGEAASTALYAVGGVLLVAMGAVLVVERLNRSYAVWASRLQTSAYRASRRGVGRIGDFMLGASLGAVWAPCIAPFFGAVVVANLAASALTGDYLLLFASTLTYAAGLALVVYLLITACLWQTRS